MYERSKSLLHSTHECVCAVHETTTSHMKDIVDIFNSEIKETRSTNQDMQNYIDSCHKESERIAAYTEQIFAHFENIVNVTVDNDSVIPQEKYWSEKDRQANSYKNNETNKGIE